MHAKDIAILQLEAQMFLTFCCSFVCVYYNPTATEFVQNSECSVLKRSTALFYCLCCDAILDCAKISDQKRTMLLSTAAAFQY